MTLMNATPASGPQGAESVAASSRRPMTGRPSGPLLPGTSSRQPTTSQSDPCALSASTASSTSSAFPPVPIMTSRPGFDISLMPDGAGQSFDHLRLHGLGQLREQRELDGLALRTLGDGQGEAR